MNTIRSGSKGDAVQQWQTILNKEPRPTTWVNDTGATRSWPALWTYPLAVDGDFGQRTVWATEAWQAARGLVADAIVGTNTWAAAGVVAPTLSAVLKGTDMASIQGVRPDSEWRALAEMGVRFSILRSIVGNETWSDTAAIENSRRAAAHGIRSWPYVFPYPLPHLSATKQAEDFVRRLADMGWRLDDVPIAFDAEWPPREEWKVIDGVKTLTYPWQKWGCSAPQLRDWVMVCIARLEELTGRRIIVYSYRYWLKCIEAHLLPELAERPLWLADYTYSGRWPTIEQCTRIAAPAPWTGLPRIVQHDGDGGLRLPQSGIDADFNVFLGEEEDLASLIAARLDVEPVTVPESSPVEDVALTDPRVAQSTLRLIVDDAIAAYRRDRIDEALASA